ncbi:Uncharacterized protein EbC_pEb17200890 (plasmid) [Erwinia billingiae Eb661]|uniref:Uncharacterized protein n=1 Tax=Erwinia billingiae (strain Eb661) TaxID=634500 RepID=D8MJU4_ERWBE|nr:Uncharacterized protein EbC_pEb17200890 [Erwinia billingiae Eb661]
MPAVIVRMLNRVLTPPCLRLGVILHQSFLLMVRTTPCRRPERFIMAL